LRTLPALKKTSASSLAMHEMGRTILSTSDLNEALDTLVLQVANSGLFRSLMVSLVDQERDTLTIVRQLGKKSKNVPPKPPEFDRTSDTMNLSDAG